MPDKIYGFQTTSISEMDICKEPYINIYTYVFAMRFRYLFICINIRTYFIILTLIKYTYIHFASPPTVFSNICNPSTIPWQANVRVAGNVLCCPCVSTVYSQYTIIYICFLKLCHTLPYTIY